MSRVVVIGGSGHVGTYLVPRLVEGGFEVVNISRGQRAAYQPHAAWRHVRTIEDAQQTSEHIAHSPSSSIAKAQRLLDYQPRYTSFDAVQESVSWLIENGIVQTGEKTSRESDRQ